MKTIAAALLAATVLASGALAQVTVTIGQNPKPQPSADPYAVPIQHTIIESFKRARQDAIDGIAMAYWAEKCQAVNDYQFQVLAGLENNLYFNQWQVMLAPAAQAGIDLQLPPVGSLSQRGRADGLDNYNRLGCSYWQQHPAVVANMRARVNGM